MQDTSISRKMILSDLMNCLSTQAAADIQELFSPAELHSFFGGGESFPYFRRHVGSVKVAHEHNGFIPIAEADSNDVINVINYFPPDEVKALTESALFFSSYV